MALFGKNTAGSTGGASARAGAGLRGEASLSIIGPGMEIVGDVVSDGDVRVQGRIQGTLRASGTVAIGKDGEVHGDLFANEAVVAGKIRGTLTAPERIHLQATCDVEGQVHAGSGHFVLDEGGRFSGQVHMGGTTLSEPPRALPAGAAAAPDGENYD